jgi:hypothetical protein
MATDRDTEADLPPLTPSELPTSAAGGTDSTTGSAIGPYHLLQLIAEAGMGQGWLAERKQSVRGRVAVKLIKSLFL